MPTNPSRGAWLLEGSRGRVMAVLALVLLAGFGLRLYGLETRGMGHIEIFVPNIPLPASLSSDPRPRMTLGATLSGVMFEPHPPAWYVFMWFWTKAFGTRLAAIRLPSVLFAAGSILLVYLLGVRAANRSTGLLAAALLAFNGHNVLWSQIARPALMACFLGLLSTWFLIEVLRAPGRTYTWLVLYLLATSAGLATLYYFWVIFAAQILVVFLVSIRLRAQGAGLFRFQMLLLTLVSPLVSVALFQSKPSYLERPAIAILADYLRFGFLYEPDPDLAATAPFTLLWLWILLLFALVLLFAGFVFTESTGSGRIKELRAPRLHWFYLAAALASASILVFAWVALDRVGADNDPFSLALAQKTPWLFASSFIPWLILLAMVLLQRYWWVARRMLRPFWSWRMVNRRPEDLVVMALAIVPLVIVTGVNLAFPFLASRHMLIFTPYLFLVFGKGMTSLAQAQPRAGMIPLALAGGAVLVTFHVASIQYHRQRPISPTDYQGLAAHWLPYIQPEDVIFVQEHWATTPIFYYLPADRYHFVGGDYQRWAGQRPAPRIWVLSFEGLPPSPGILTALEGYTPELRLQSLRIRTELYRARRP